jgi:hypothetical protein
MVVDGVPMISDVEAAERAAGYLAAWWPDEHPASWGPWACGGYGSMPLMVSQVGNAIGGAAVTFEPGPGRSARLILDLHDRRHLPTHVEWSVSDHMGRVLFRHGDWWEPTLDHERRHRLLGPRSDVLLDDQWHGPWLRMGRGVELTWRVRVVDVHGVPLAARAFVRTHWLERQAG